ncbi:MAG: fructosamine kinase family protein [Vicinamibacterales bacterium]
MTLTAAVESALQHALGADVRIERRVPLAGGSINRTERLDTTAGRFVLKTHDAPPEGMFRAEALGLTALRDSGTPLTIPQVIAWQDTAPAFLVLEFLAEGRRQPDFDEQLGRGLAALHRATAPKFGFAEDNYCGATLQPNPWRERWVDFYADARLGHQLKLASRSGLLTGRDAGRVQQLIDRVGDWLSEPVSGPALIHGDLWSGNLHADAAGRPALIDPAVYYAHREAELGMMTLFGGFSSRTFDAYHEAFPLEPDWRDRNPLYQLYHLMNHLNLFGDSYRAQVMAIVHHFV